MVGGYKHRVAVTGGSVKDLCKASSLDEIHEAVDVVIGVQQDVVNGPLWHVQDFIDKIENTIGSLQLGYYDFGLVKISTLQKQNKKNVYTRTNKAISFLVVVIIAKLT